MWLRFLVNWRIHCWFKRVYLRLWKVFYITYRSFCRFKKLLLILVAIKDRQSTYEWGQWEVVEDGDLFFINEWKIQVRQDYWWLSGWWKNASIQGECLRRLIEVGTGCGIVGEWFWDSWVITFCWWQWWFGWVFMCFVRECIEPIVSLLT